MIKIYSNNDEKLQENTKLLEKVEKKMGLEKDQVQFVAFESFFGSTLFLMALVRKEMHLISDENKHKPQRILLSQVKEIVVEKKTDLNLILKDGKSINLTSVVGVKPSVINMVKFMNKEIDRNR